MAAAVDRGRARNRAHFAFGSGPAGKAGALARVRLNAAISDSCLVPADCGSVTSAVVHHVARHWIRGAVNTAVPAVASAFARPQLIVWILHDCAVACNGSCAAVTVVENRARHRQDTAIGSGVTAVAFAGAVILRDAVAVACQVTVVLAVSAKPPRLAKVAALPGPVTSARARAVEVNYSVPTACDVWVMLASCARPAWAAGAARCTGESDAASAGAGGGLRSPSDDCNPAVCFLSRGSGRRAWRRLLRRRCREGGAVSGDFCRAAIAVYRRGALNGLDVTELAREAVLTLASACRRLRIRNRREAVPDGQGCVSVAVWGGGTGHRRGLAVSATPAIATYAPASLCLLVRRRCFAEARDFSRVARAIMNVARYGRERAVGPRPAVLAHAFASDFLGCFNEEAGGISVAWDLDGRVAAAVFCCSAQDRWSLAEFTAPAVVAAAERHAVPERGTNHGCAVGPVIQNECEVVE